MGPAASAPLAAPAAKPPATPSGGGGLGDVVSPLAGTVVEVQVAAGDPVTQGQPVVILEAMKMNTTVTASRTGTVKSVAAQAGTSVAEGQVLLSIE
jgi:biotin carboxyl carrier protein